MCSKSQMCQMDENTKHKYAITFTLGFGYFAYAAAANVFGAAMTDLKELMNIDDSEISYGFISQNGAFFLMALLSGCLFEVVNRQLVFAMSCFAMAICSVVIPFVTNLYIFLLVQGFNGLSGGIVSSVVNVWVLEIWQENSNVYIQWLNFMYAFGSALGPLIAAPFLSPDRNETVTHSLSAEGLNASLSTENLETQIIVPFSVSGALLFVGSILIIALYVVKPYENSCNDKEISINSSESLPIRKSDLVWYKVSVIGLGSLLLGVYTGLEYNSMQYLETFAVYSGLHFSKIRGAFFSTAFGTAFTISTGINILVATKLKSSTMLSIDFFIIAIGSSILLLFGNRYETCFWMSNILLGLGFASVTPSLFEYVGERIEVTDTVGGIMTCFTSVAMISIAVFQGQFVKACPQIYVYLTLGGAFLCTLSFVLLRLIDSYR